MAEKKINGRTFRSLPGLATQVTLLQVRLLTMASPVVDRLGDIFAGMQTTDPSLKGKSELAALAAIGEVFKHNRADEIVSFVAEVISFGEIQRPSKEYGRLDMDGDFTGKVGDLLPVVIFILQVQLSDFFTGFRGNGAPGRAAAED